jgi:hypothetical protein
LKEFSRNAAFAAQCYRGFWDVVLKKASQLTVILLAFLLLGSIFPTSAQAPDEPSVNPWGQAGLKYTETAKTLGMGKLTLTASGDVSLDNSAVQLVKIPGNDTLFPQGAQYSVMPAIGFGILNFLDFSAALPVYFDMISQYTELPPGNINYGGLQAGIGDVEMKLKLQVPPRTGPRVVDLAFLAGLSLPTGSSTQGYFPRHIYYLLKDSTQETPDRDTVKAISGSFTSGAPEIEGKILFTFNCFEHGDVVPLMLHVNLGGRVIAARGFDQVFLLGVAAEYRPAPWFSMYAEASAEPRLESITNKFAIGNDPFRISPGIAIHLPEGMFISLGGDWSLSTHDPVAYDVQGAYFLRGCNRNGS